MLGLDSKPGRRKGEVDEPQTVPVDPAADVTVLEVAATHPIPQQRTDSTPAPNPTPLRRSRPSQPKRADTPVESGAESTPKAEQ